MALPKAHRLKLRHDFNTVYQRGRRYHSQNLTLVVLKPNQETRSPDVAASPPTLIGISIGSKVSKRAVVRNRIKRQIKAILRQFLPTLRPGWKIVVVVRPTAVECDYPQFLQELKKLLIDAEVFDGHSGRCVL
ncbi:MAG TPA: ribonuclease P protein component [Synechococcales cyanobacterium M55_K2018_004]|nr:ribonuclease P protein component [Synechococcales cyanobacterium M55_K2018_004]